MSLQLAANHLAAQGRGPDTTLVHMGQGEVDALQGLAAAHGGMLTTNPTTGLPEAGFLSSILPVLAGAAGSFVGIPPWATMALVGGITGAATGNLNKGLMAGLGAYGGSSLAGGLGAMGAGGAGAAGSAGAASSAGAATAGSAGAAAVPAAATAAAPVASTAGTAMPAITPASFSPITHSASAIPAGAAEASQGLASVPKAVGASTVMPQAAAPAATQVASATPTMMGPPTPYSAMSPAQRFAEVQNNFTGENLLKYASDNPKSAAAAFAPLAMNLMKPKKYKEDPEDTDPGQQYNYEANPTEPTPEPDPYGRGQTYFKPRYVNRAAGGTMRGLPSAESNLGSYSAGGRGRLLRGPGDGVSDSIPAVIGNKQPARLADGEFVIPARIVSELGNGSTEAGAKQLYAMMDRIQRARSKTTGKKQVAKNTKAHKLMPA